MPVVYALRHLLSILILPFTVTILVPVWIGRTYGIALTAPTTVTGWLAGALGVAILGTGVALAAASVKLFAVRGRGTLAPWDPPRALVVSGVYAHVRNPMISGVIFVLAGEAVALRSAPHAAWAALFAAGNLVQILLVEEPMLRSRFGAAYERYTRHVPRLIPRRRSWSADSPPSGDEP